MRVTAPFLSLYLVSAVHGRYSTPFSRSPFVVGRDVLHARSVTSLSTSPPVVVGGVGTSGGSRVTSSIRTNEDLEDSENSSVEDVARGGHTSTMVLSQEQQQQEESEHLSTERNVSVEEQGETTTTSSRGTIGSAVATAPNTVGNVTSLSTRGHMSTTAPVHTKKRRRKKDKHRDGSAAVYAKKLKNRNNLNIRRKVMHAAFGLFFGGLNYFIPKSKFVPGMTILTSATLIMELLRYKKGFGWMNDALHGVLGSSLRKHEMEGKFTGSFYFFLGVTVTAALYPRTCATLGICQLALADPSASYFGRQTRHVYWSRIENGLGGFGRNKGFLGFLGGALFCFPFNYRVLSIAKHGTAIPGGMRAVVFASLALGFAGAFADLAVPTPALTLPKKILGVPVPPFHVDDNFVVPIVSGFACTKVFSSLGWPTDLELSRFVLL